MNGSGAAGEGVKHRRANVGCCEGDGGGEGVAGDERADEYGSEEIAGAGVGGGDGLVGKGVEKAVGGHPCVDVFALEGNAGEQNRARAQVQQAVEQLLQLTDGNGRDGRRAGTQQRAAGLNETGRAGEQRGLGQVGSDHVGGGAKAAHCVGHVRGQRAVHAPVVAQNGIDNFQGLRLTLHEAARKLLLTHGRHVARVDGIKFHAHPAPFVQTGFQKIGQILTDKVREGRVRAQNRRRRRDYLNAHGGNDRNGHRQRAASHAAQIVQRGYSFCRIHKKNSFREWEIWWKHGSPPVFAPWAQSPDSPAASGGGTAKDGREAGRRLCPTPAGGGPPDSPQT